MSICLLSTHDKAAISVWYGTPQAREEETKHFVFETIRSLARMRWRNSLAVTVDGLAELTRDLSYLLMSSRSKPDFWKSKKTKRKPTGQIMNTIKERYIKAAAPGRDSYLSSFAQKTKNIICHHTKTGLALMNRLARQGSGRRREQR